jgi:hypothetical protein
MTTPEGAPGGAKTGPAKSAPKARVRRSAPERTKPIRAAAAAPPSIATAPVEAAGESSINDAIAQAVRSGYDVIADNIQQGRAAAARFRQGEYNIRDVPDDVSTVLLRLMQLARELSTTTFDVCEKLLKDMRPPASGAAPTGAAADPTPPFRPHPAPPQRPEPAPPAPGPAQMKLTVRFEGAPNAVARTGSLNRPSQPTLPRDLVVTPLAPRDPNGPVISQVRFETDISVEGLVAVVTVPPGLPAGVYSGLVRAPDDDVPLGVLTVEIA